MNTEEKIEIIKKYGFHTPMNVSKTLGGSSCYVYYECYLSLLRDRAPFNGYVVLDFEHNKIIINDWNGEGNSLILDHKSSDWDKIIDRFYFILKKNFCQRISEPFKLEINKRLEKIKVK